MPVSSTSHLLLIPSYNSGPIVVQVVSSVLEVWAPVWVVVDGSDDGTAELLDELAGKHQALKIIRHDSNRGKGSAIYTGIKEALERNYTHMLVMDADGQHPVEHIQAFMRLSQDKPEAMVLGVPLFSDDAPALRVKGRKISNFWANLETLWAGINDSLFGFRVYPLVALKSVMDSTFFARRFDFDPEVVVRLTWQGVPALNRPVPVRYLTAEEGGVSQFKYLRDNVLLTWMHTRLFIGFVFRLPLLLYRRRVKNRD